MATATEGMPFELVDDEYIVRHVRVGGKLLTEEQAQQFFANEWGVTLPEVKVSRTFMYDPGPECECGDTATGGLRYLDGLRGMFCAECADAVVEEVAPEPVTRIPLSEAVPYDGWPMRTCDENVPGATAYWAGEEPTP